MHGISVFLSLPGHCRSLVPMPSGPLMLRWSDLRARASFNVAATNPTHTTLRMFPDGCVMHAMSPACFVVRSNLLLNRFAEFP